jgi:adenine-specific DNA-methyltransferase
VYGNNQEAKKEVLDLFEGDEPFSTPKPLKLISQILKIATKPSTNDIVLDFFAGSCSTAHAVMRENELDGGNRRFIMVQLPEAIKGSSDNDISTISSLGCERIKRAAQLITNDKKLDLGVKVFKLSYSNIQAWNPDRTDLEASLLSHEEHLIEGRSEQDVLYELLLKRGVDLTVPIESREVNGKNIYSIGYGVLFACLDESINREQMEDIAQGILDWHKELSPSSETHVFFRDSAFRDDVSKTNMAAILEQNGISHVRSL